MTVQAHVPGSRCIHHVHYMQARCSCLRIVGNCVPLAPGIVLLLLFMILTENMPVSGPFLIWNSLLNVPNLE